MAELTVEELRDALRGATRDNEVFPSVVRLIAVTRGWSGRLWEVLGVLAEDQETLHFVAGGARPDEITDCAERWAATSLDLEQLRLVLRSGGYDPDPFDVLARAGLLANALRDETGGLRHVQGARAGTWISDELALTSSEHETIEAVRRMIAETSPAPATSVRKG